MKMNEYYIYFVLHLKYTSEKMKAQHLPISDVHFALSAYIGCPRRKLAFDAAFVVCNDEEYDMSGKTKAHK